MDKITELIKLEAIERRFYKISKSWIFETVEVQDTYSVIKNILTVNDPANKEAETLKELLKIVNMDQLKYECKLLIDIWNYADSKGYEDICELIDINPSQALLTINDVLEYNTDIIDHAEIVEYWG